MFKRFIDIFRSFGKHIPKCVKNEVNTMRTGVKELGSQIKKNYKDGAFYDKLHGNGPLKEFTSGAGAVLANTKITRKEIPSVFAMVATPIPLPLTSPVAYALGRVVTSDRAMNVYRSSKRALNVVCPFL